MEELKKFRKFSGKQNSLITCYFYNKSKEEAINFISKQLDLVQNIKDSYKKKMANDLIYNFKCHIENEPTSNINMIYLVSPEEINSFNLSKDQINILKEYNKPEYLYDVSDTYNINYLEDLFTDFTFYKVYELDKKSITEYQIKSTKKKKIASKKVSNQTELVELIDKSVDLVHGTSTFLKNFNCEIINFNKRLSEEEVLEQIYKIKITNTHNDLRNLLDNITNPEYEDKIIFGGKETKKYTELSMLSKLYIHESIYKKFLNVFKEYINFSVVEVKKLESGDISDTLKNDYDKCIGELYFKKTF